MPARHVPAAAPPARQPRPLLLLLLPQPYTTNPTRPVLRPCPSRRYLCTPPEPPPARPTPAPVKHHPSRPFRWCTGTPAGRCLCPCRCLSDGPSHLLLRAPQGRCQHRNLCCPVRQEAPMAVVGVVQHGGVGVGGAQQLHAVGLGANRERSR